MQIQKKMTLKTIGLLTSLFYFTTHVLYADQGLPQKSLSLPSVVMTSSQIAKKIVFDVPHDLGQLNGYFEGQKSPLIVHIQDAHANPSAQRNIAKIIDHFVTNYGAEWIGVEGASGQLWSEPLTYASDDDVRRIVADYYLDQGRLTGAEYYRIVMSDQAQLFGVEDSNLYDEHHKIYTQYLQNKEKYLNNYRKTREHFDRVVELYKNTKLKEWIQLQEDFGSDRISLMAYLQRFFDYAEHGEIDISHSPYLFFLKTNLMSENSSAEVLATLSKNASQILEEIKMLRLKIDQILVKTEEDRVFVEWAQAFNILKNLVQLSLTKEDTEFLFKHPHYFEADFFESFFRDHLKEELPENFKEYLGEAIDQASKFYQLAIKRDETLVDHALDQIEKTHSKVVVLVAGGFHTPGIARKLKSEDLSYIIVTPKLDVADNSNDQQLYENAMLETPLFSSAFNEKEFDLLMQEMSSDALYQLVPSLIHPQLPLNFRLKEFLDNNPRVLRYWWLVTLLSMFRNKGDVDWIKSSVDIFKEKNVKSQMTNFLFAWAKKYTYEASPSKSGSLGLLYRAIDQDNTSFVVYELTQGGKKPTFRKKTSNRFQTLELNRFDLHIFQNVPSYLLSEEIVDKMEQRSELRMDAPALYGPINPGSQAEQLRLEQIQIEEILKSSLEKVSPIIEEQGEEAIVEIVDQYPVDLHHNGQTPIQELEAFLQNSDKIKRSTSSNNLFFFTEGPYLIFQTAPLSIALQNGSASGNDVTSYQYKFSEDKFNVVGWKRIWFDAANKQIFSESRVLHYEENRIFSYRSSISTDQGNFVYEGRYIYGEEGKLQKEIVDVKHEGDLDFLEENQQISIFDWQSDVVIVEKIYKPRKVNGKIILASTLIAENKIPDQIIVANSDFESGAPILRLAKKVVSNKFGDEGELVTQDIIDLNQVKLRRGGSSKAVDLFPIKSSSRQSSPPPPGKKLSGGFDEPRVSIKKSTYPKIDSRLGLPREGMPKGGEEFEPNFEDDEEDEDDEKYQGDPRDLMPKPGEDFEIVLGEDLEAGNEDESISKELPRPNAEVLLEEGAEDESEGSDEADDTEEPVFLEQKSSVNDPLDSPNQALIEQSGPKYLDHDILVRLSNSTLSRYFGSAFEVILSLLNMLTFGLFLNYQRHLESDYTALKSTAKNTNERTSWLKSFFKAGLIALVVYWILASSFVFGQDRLNSNSSERILKLEDEPIEPLLSVSGHQSEFSLKSEAYTHSDGRLGFPVLSATTGERRLSESLQLRINDARKRHEKIVQVGKGEEIFFIHDQLLESDIRELERRLDPVVINYGRATGVLHDLMTEKQRRNINKWHTDRILSDKRWSLDNPQPYFDELYRIRREILTFWDETSSELVMYRNLADLVRSENVRDSLSRHTSPLDSQLLIHDLATNGNVNRGDELYRVLPNNIRTVRFRLPVRSFGQLDFFYVTSQGMEEKVKIRSLHIDPILTSENEPEFVVRADLIFEPSVQSPEEVGLRIRPLSDSNATTTKQILESLKSYSTSVGHVDQRIRHNIPGSQLAGSLMVERQDMSLVREGELIGKVEIYEKILTYFKVIEDKNFEKRLRYVLKQWLESKNFKEAQERFEKFWQGYHFSAEEYEKFKTVMERIETLRKSLELREVHSPAEGLLMDFSLHHQQPSGPLTSLGTIATEKVTVTVDHLPGEVPVKEGEIVYIKHPLYQTLIMGTMVKVENAIDNSNGYALPGFKKVKILVSDGFQLAEGFPVQVVFPESENVALPKRPDLPAPYLMSFGTPATNRTLSPYIQLAILNMASNSTVAKGEDALMHELLIYLKNESAFNHRDEVIDYLFKTHPDFFIRNFEEIIRTLKDEEVSKIFYRIQSHQEALNLYVEILRKRDAFGDTINLAFELAQSHLKELLEHDPEAMVLLGKKTRDHVDGSYRSDVEKIIIKMMSEELKTSRLVYSAPIIERVMQSDFFKDDELLHFSRALKSPLAELFASALYRRLNEAQAKNRTIAYAGRLANDGLGGNVHLYRSFFDLHFDQQDVLLDQKTISESPHWDQDSLASHLNKEVTDASTVEFLKRISFSKEGEVDDGEMNEIVGKTQAVDVDSFSFMKQWEEVKQRSFIQTQFDKNQFSQIIMILKSDELRNRFGEQIVTGLTEKQRDANARVYLAKLYAESNNRDIDRLIENSVLLQMLMADLAGNPMSKETLSNGIVTTFPASTKVMIYQTALLKFHAHNDEIPKKYQVSPEQLRRRIISSIVSYRELAEIKKRDSKRLEFLTNFQIDDNEKSDDTEHFVDAADSELLRRSYIDTIEIFRKTYSFNSGTIQTPGNIEGHLSNLENYLQIENYSYERLMELKIQSLSDKSLKDSRIDFFYEMQDYRYQQMQKTDAVDKSNETSLASSAIFVFSKWIFLPLAVLMLGIGFLQRFILPWITYFRTRYHAVFNSSTSTQKQINLYLARHAVDVNPNDDPFDEEEGKIRNELRADEFNEALALKKRLHYKSNDMERTIQEWGALLLKNKLSPQDYPTLIHYATKAINEKALRFYPEKLLNVYGGWKISQEQNLAQDVSKLIELTIRKFLDIEVPRLFDESEHVLVQELISHTENLLDYWQILENYRKMLGYVAGLEFVQGNALAKMQLRSGVSHSFFTYMGFGVNRTLRAFVNFLIRPFIFYSQIGWFGMFWLLPRAINQDFKDRNKIIANFYQEKVQLKKNDDEKVEIASKVTYPFIKAAFFLQTQPYNWDAHERNRYRRILSRSLMFITVFPLIALGGFQLLAEQLDIPVAINFWKTISVFLPLTILGYGGHIWTVVNAFSIAGYHQGLAKIRGFRKSVKVMKRSYKIQKVSMREVEYKETLRAFENEMLVNAEASLDLIVISYSGNQRNQFEANILKHIEGFYRKKGVVVLFIAGGEEFLGTGGLEMQFDQFLTKRYDAFRMLNPSLPEKSSDLRMLHLMVGAGFESDMMSIIRGGDYRELPLSYREKNLSTLHFQIMNAYRAAQEHRKRGYTRIRLQMPSDVFYLGPIRTQNSLKTIITTPVSADEIMQQRRGVVFDGYSAYFRHLIEKPSSLDDINLYTHRQRKATRSYLDQKNSEVRQYFGTTAMTIDIPEPGNPIYEEYQFFKSKVYELANEYHKKTGLPIYLDSTVHLLVPFFSSESYLEKNIEQYVIEILNRKIVDTRLREFYLGLVDIYKSFRARVKDIEQEEGKVFPVRVFSPTDRQSVFVDLRNIQTYRQFLFEGIGVPEKLLSESAQHGKVENLVFDPTTKNIYENTAYRVTDVENLYLAGVNLNKNEEMATDSTAYVFYAQNESPSIFNRLLGEKGELLIRRFVDRHGRSLFLNDDRQPRFDHVKDLPIFPIGHNAESRIWLNQINQIPKGDIVLDVEGYEELSGKYISLNEIKRKLIDPGVAESETIRRIAKSRMRSGGSDDQTSKTKQDDHRSELRQEDFFGDPRLWAGLDAIERMNLYHDLAALSTDDIVGMLTQFVAYEIPSDPIKKDGAGQIYFEWDADVYDFENFKKRVQQLSKDVTLTVVPKSKIELAERRELYTKLRKEFSGNKKVKFPAFSKKTWDVESFWSDLNNTHRDEINSWLKFNVQTTLLKEIPEEAREKLFGAFFKMAESDVVVIRFDDPAFEESKSSFSLEQIIKGIQAIRQSA